MTTPETVKDVLTRVQQVNRELETGGAIGIGQGGPPPHVAQPRVPARYRHARFETMDDLTDKIDGWLAAVTAVQAWTIDVIKGRPHMLALIGPQGTGKSHLAACAAWRLYEHGATGIWVAFHLWEELVDDLRYGRVEGNEAFAHEASGHEIRTRLMKQPAVILDDIEHTSGTEFDATELRKFSKNRYSHMRSALITGNWKDLADMIGAPAADRYSVVKLVGPSYR